MNLLPYLLPCWVLVLIMNRDGAIRPKQKRKIMSHSHSSSRAQHYNTNQERHLKLWLLVVAFLRGISIFSGYLRPELLLNAITSLDYELAVDTIYSNDGDSNHTTIDPLAQLHARTFAIWTCLSCIICCITAFNLQSQPMVYTALSSFYVVGFYFTMEYSVFGTVKLEKLAPMIVVAGVSIVWLHLHLGSICSNVAEQYKGSKSERFQR